MMGGWGGGGGGELKQCIFFIQIFKWGNKAYLANLY